MLTQCPHCLTYFRVGPDHLKAAAGQVRCCRCHQVFNALQHLEEAPVSFANTTSASESHTAVEKSPEDQANTATEAATETPQRKGNTKDWLDFGEQRDDHDFQPMLPELAPEPNSDELLEDIVEQNDGLEPEPDYFAEGTESQMSELLDQDSSSLLLPDTGEPYGETPNGAGNIFTFNTPPPETGETEAPLTAPEFEDSILKDDAIDENLGKPDYDSVPALRTDTPSPTEPLADDDQTLNFATVDLPKPHNKSRRLWLIGCLLLLPPLAGQLAWLFRDDLIQHAPGRQSLNLLCQIAGCEVPKRRAVDKILIQGRNLSSHPDKPETLFLQVNIVNTAPFDQPFPRLTLSLYNDKGELIARRTFSASDYLPSEYASLELMPKAQPILVEMELVDPGKEVTGFSFDFY